MRCAFIIPVYNEENEIADTVLRLQEVLQRIKGWETTIICVNDGSSDGTARELAALKNVQVISHIRNRGYGAALKTGLSACSDYEWVAIVDADRTYPLEDFPRFLDHIKAHEMEKPAMVVGMRKGAGILQSPAKAVARFILKKLVYVLTGTLVRDLNSGMRVFRYDLYAECMHLLPAGFSFTTTLTVASLYSGYRVDYFEIQYEKRSGKSHIKPIRDFLNFTILICRLAAYFDPLRLFLPLSYLFILTGLVRGVRDVFVVNSIGSLAIILTLMGFQFGFNGLILDAMQRLIKAPVAQKKIV